MKILWVRYRLDVLVFVLLLLIPLALFWETTLGGKTLIPADNLYQWEPWASFKGEMGIGVPHNELLSDLVLENYAWKRFILQSLRQPDAGVTNRLPLWNPYLWAGAPFLADGQHSALYPFSLLFYVLPLPVAYGWFTVLQFWLAGMFMYALARTLGTNRIGGLIAGIVYQLSLMFVVSTVFTMIIATMPWLPLLLALIEQIIRQQEQGGRQSALYVVGGGLAMGVMMLAGHPEYTAYTGMVMGLYALARLIWMIAVGGRAQAETRRAVWPRAFKAGGWLLLMVALGGMLGAAQFVPLYEYATTNFRQGLAGYEEVIGWAFPKRRLIAMLIPNFFGNPTHHRWFDFLEWQWHPVARDIHGNPTMTPNTIYWEIKNAVEGGSYVGILPLLLALIAVLGRFDLRRLFNRSPGIRPESLSLSLSVRRFYVWFFVGLALFSLTLVFGLPTYRLIFALPFLNQLHSPFRWLFPYTLSIALLAGIGASYLSGAGRRTTSWQSPFTGENTQRIIGWPVFWAGVAILVGLLLSLPIADHLYPLAERAVMSLALAEFSFESGRMFFMYQWLNLLVFALMLIAAGALLRVVRCPIYLPERLGGYAVWKPLAVLIVLLDLFMAGYGFNPAADPAWLDFTPPAVQFLKAQQAQDPFFRITAYVAPGEKTFNANSAWLFDIEDIRGYGSIISRQYVDYVSLIANQYELLYNRVAPISTEEWWALDSPLLDLLNVKYVVTTQTIDLPKYALVYDGEMRIYENKGVMPRVFTLPAESVVYTKDVGRAVQKYDPRYFVILDGAPRADEPQPGVPGPARISRYMHNEVFVDVDLDAPAWLVLTDSYARGWKAFVRPFGGAEADESELTIARHAGNFRAVLLSAGSHTVRFKYTPVSVKVGLFLTFLSAMLMALILAMWVWRRYLGGGQQEGAALVAKNSLAPIVLQLFNKAIDTAFAMLMLRILAPAGAGQYYFIVNVIVYTDIFINFGLNIWLQREAAKAKAASGRYLGDVLLLRLALCMVAAPLLGLFVIGWGQVGEPLSAAQVWALTLFALGLAPANVAAALTALFQAYERMEVPALITVLSTVIKAALGTATLLLGWSLVGLGGVSIVTNLVAVTILGLWAAQIGLVPQFRLEVGNQLRVLRESWPLMINNLLSMAFFKVDVLLLEAMKGSLVQGLYSSVAYKLIDAINIIPSSFTLALFPLMSRYAESSKTAMHRAYRLVVRLLVWVSLPLALVLTTLALPIANLVGGSGYIPDSAIALQLMVWSIPFGFINSVTHYLLIALGRQRELTWTFVIGVGFNIVANLLLIPRWSYRASALIHIASELVLLIAFYVLMCRDLPPVPWVSLLWRPALAGALMGVSGRLLYGVNIWLATAVALSVYGGTLWALGTFDDPDLAIVRQRWPGRADEPSGVLS